MTAEEMWKAYGGDPEQEYEAWSFGDDADALAQLVLRGEKTATASAYALYALEDEPLPEAGEYSVILNSREQAVCIIRTTRVYVERFDRVSAIHAHREGEGDKSLAYWQAVHQRFFTRCLEEAGLSFTPQMQVVCEEFEKVYPL